MRSFYTEIRDFASHVVDLQAQRHPAVYKGDVLRLIRRRAHRAPRVGAGRPTARRSFAALLRIVGLFETLHRSASKC